MVIWCLGWLFEKLGDLLVKLCWLVIAVWLWLNSLGRESVDDSTNDDNDSDTSETR